MKEDVEELVKLYEQGTKISNDYDELCYKIVPTRLYQSTSIPQIVKTGPLGLPAFQYPDPEPESPQTVELLQSVIKYADNWNKEVNIVLERIGKNRYKMQFNDARGSAVKSIHIGQLTDNEQELVNVLDDFGDRIGELRKIIIDFESSSERALPASDGPIEPATYDHKTRTIFFADEAIRFNKNAEYSPAICQLMFKDPNKLWQLKDFQSVWDSLYDYLDLAKPTDWNRVYDVILKMNTRISNATGITDLFKLTTKSVRLNPKYITPSK